MRKILSIDGGGIRGLIPAMVLTELEMRAGRPVAECFDLIAGTSTGGILALGLSAASDTGKSGGKGGGRGGGSSKSGAAQEFSAADLAAIYEERGRDIFQRSRWQGALSLREIVDETYSHASLEAVLEEFFGGRRLRDSLTNVLITAYDIQRRCPLFLKSWKAEHGSVTIKDAARATSAAPTYFEPARIEVDGEMRELIDGGVFINSPAVSAYVEARRLFPDESRFVLLSLGTGELLRPIRHAKAKTWGKARWLAPLLSCMFDGVSDAADYQMQALLGQDYYRLQTRLNTASDDMDNTAPANLQRLKQEATALLQTYESEINTLSRLLAE